MSDSNTQVSRDALKPAKAPVIEDKTFKDLLRSLLGKTVTIVNPESYEDAPVGHQIRAGFYRAKVVAMGEDYLTVLTEFVHSGRETGKEPVKQIIPLSGVKRISLLKNERLIHI